MFGQVCADIGDQHGRVAIVTGANRGLGLDVAGHLAASGATVVLACRSKERAELARSQILARETDADVRLLDLDLGYLASVRRAAEVVASEHDRLDILINNAAVLEVPRDLTADGFEIHFGVNHLGHFLLTSLLFPLLWRTAGSRIVSVSSRAHRFGRIRFDDLQSERRFSPMRAYGASKLAQMLFAFELQRRLESLAAPVLSLAADPGGDGVVQPIAGALPILSAAVDPSARAEDYFGPGENPDADPPRRIPTSARAVDPVVSARLWEVSCELAGAVWADGHLGGG